jgi:hypothetical protein
MIQKNIEIVDKKFFFIGIVCVNLVILFSVIKWRLNSYICFVN